MKTNIIRLAGIFAVGVLLSVSARAVTLTFGDAYSLGSVTPGHPDSDPDQVAVLNQLIDLAAGNNQVVGDYTYDRTSNFQPGSGLTNASTTDADRVDGPSFDLGDGYLYIVAKYGNGIPGADGNGFYAWYVAGLTGEITVPDHALSHISAYNPGEPGNNVPDGGMTAVLLGLGLVALSFAARRRLA